MIILLFYNIILLIELVAIDGTLGHDDKAFANGLKDKGIKNCHVHGTYYNN